MIFHKFVMSKVFDNEIDLGALGMMSVCRDDEDALKIIDQIISIRPDWNYEELLNFVTSDSYRKHIVPVLEKHGRNPDKIIVAIIWWALTFASTKDKS